MPKLPRVRFGGGSRNAAARFEVSRHRGSHIVMRRGGSGCVVPDHREIKVGTLAGALRQAGVTVEEFISAL